MPKTRKPRTIVAALALGAVITAVMATTAAAQTCGDANDNDAVTVTDGVQALRAAAGLPSSCEDGCDVDGSGTVTVSDGVNILRKAAGITINEVCDFTTQEANGLVNPSLAVFGGMTKIPGVGTASAFTAGAAGGADCDNDGTVERSQKPGQSSATFTDCEIGGALLDGTISRGVFGQGSVLAFDEFTITRVKTGKSLTFDGQLDLTDEQVGKRLDGTLTITSAERGTFALQFQRILLLGDGSVREGALVYDLANADGGNVARIQITFDEGDELPASVVLRNKQVRQFILDRSSRSLHPAS